MRRLIRCLAALSVLLLLLGNSNCSQNNESDAPQFVTSLLVENSSGVVSGGFAKGDTINLVLTIRNRSSSAQTLYFNSSEFANFAVVDAGTASVEWNCDNDPTTCTTTGSLTTATTSNGGSGFFQIDFKAFQSKTITFSWTQIDNSGVQLAAGDYEVMGGFTVYNTAGPSGGADNGASMSQGAPTANQLFPSVYRSELESFSIQ
jgi:hypothetical protein